MALQACSMVQNGVSHAHGIIIKRNRRPLTVQATAEIGQVTEVSVGNFWPTLKAATGRAVVLDIYTDWCGPCKIMAPKFQKLSQKYQDVVFLKMDCNDQNRPLAKELGIKVVPTFKIFKNCKIVKEITGAKFDDLVVAIENAREDC